MGDVVGGILLLFSILLAVIAITEWLGFHTFFNSLLKIGHAPLFKIKLFLGGYFIPISNCACTFNTNVLLY